MCMGWSGSGSIVPQPVPGIPTVPLSKLVDVDVWYGSSLRFISTGLRLGIWSAIRVFKSLIVVRHSPVAFCSTTFDVMCVAGLLTSLLNFFSSVWYCQWPL